MRPLLLAGALAVIAGAAFADPAPAPAPAAVAAPAKPLPPRGDVVVVGLNGRTVTLTAAALSDLPRDEATMTIKGQAHKFEGVTLTSVLRLVGAPAGALVHADAVRDYIVVTGADKFRAVIDIADTDASVQAHPVILADKIDGHPLDPRDAPFRLVVDGDKKPARSVYGVVRIELKTLK